MSDRDVPFASRPSDAPRVKAALSTADRAWRRGDRADAVRWVERAAHAAREAGDERRAAELDQHVAALNAEIGAAVEQPPTVPSVHPSTSAPPVPAATPSAVHLLVKPKTTRTRVVPPLPPNDEPGVGVGLPDFQDDETKQADFIALGAEKTRRKTPGGAPEGEASKPPAVDESEPATLSRANLSAALATSAVPPRFKRRPTQALRVRVWREPDGRLSLTPAGSPAPAHAVEAMLTALDPDTDLLSLTEE